MLRNHWNYLLDHPGYNHIWLRCLHHKEPVRDDEQLCWYGKDAWGSQYLVRGDAWRLHNFIHRSFNIQVRVWRRGWKHNSQCEVGPVREHYEEACGLAWWCVECRRCIERYPRIGCPIPQRCQLGGAGCNVWGAVRDYKRCDYRLLFLMAGGFGRSCPDAVYDDGWEYRSEDRQAGHGKQ